MKKMMGLAFCLAACGALAGQGEGVWRLLPVSGGGNMTGVEISPSHPNVWYAYADVGGPYRSDDAGRTWWPLHASFTVTQRGVNADHVRGLPDGRKRGLWRTEDDGLTWRLVAGAEAPLEMAQIPGETALVGIFEDGHGSELRRSDDGGRTWADFHQGLPRPPEKPDPNLWYSRPGLFLAIAAGPDFLLACDWDGNPYRRAAGDAAWRAIAVESLRQGNPATESLLRRNNLELKTRCSTCSITIDPNDPAHILTTDWYDIWESRDGGKSWVTRIDTISPVVPFTVSCDPHSDRNILYGLADQLVAVSNDGGLTFQAAVGGSGDMTDFAWSERRPGRAYAVGGKGAWAISVSEDAGRTWRYSKYDGLAASRWLKDGGGVFGVAVDPVTDDVYVCRGGQGRRLPFARRRRHVGMVLQGNGAREGVLPQPRVRRRRCGLLGRADRVLVRRQRADGRQVHGRDVSARPCGGRLGEAVRTV